MNAPKIALPGHLPIQLHKQELETLAVKHAQSIHAHPQLNLIKTYLELKRYQLYFESLLHELEPLVAGKMGQLGLKQYELGALRLKHSFKVRYDFASDPVFREIQELLAQTKQTLKTRKTELLQLSQEGREEENPFTGQTFQAKKPLARGADVVYIQQV